MWIPHFVISFWISFKYRIFVIYSNIIAKKKIKQISKKLNKSKLKGNEKDIYAKVGVVEVKVLIQYFVFILIQ